MLKQRTVSQLVQYEDLGILRGQVWRWASLSEWLLQTLARMMGFSEMKACRAVLSKIGSRELTRLATFLLLVANCYVVKADIRGN